MASRILSGLTVISFAGIPSGPVVQNGCLEVRKFHASVGPKSVVCPSFACVGMISSSGSTSAYQRSCFQNARRKRSSKLARSAIRRAPAVKSRNFELSEHNVSRQASNVLTAGNCAA